jgi:hypothetical protein
LQTIQGIFDNPKLRTVRRTAPDTRLGINRDTARPRPKVEGIIMSRKKYILNRDEESNTVLVNKLCALYVRKLLDEQKIVAEHFEENGFDHPKTIEVLDTFFWKFESYFQSFAKEENM